jgi:hypothetical protein
MCRRLSRRGAFPYRRASGCTFTEWSCCVIGSERVESSRSAEAPRRACTLNVLHASSDAHTRSARQLSRFAEPPYVHSHVRFPRRTCARCRARTPDFASPSQAILRLVVDYFLVPLCSLLSRRALAPGAYARLRPVHHKRFYASRSTISSFHCAPYFLVEPSRRARMLDFAQSITSDSTPRGRLFPRSNVLPTFSSSPRAGRVR